MKIKELIWLMANRDKLEEEDYQKLQTYDLFSQYDQGELHHNGEDFLALIKLVIQLHEKYNK